MTWTEAVVYWTAQVTGEVMGTVLANPMFSRAAVEISTKVRSSPGLWLGEVVATFGLLLVIFGVVRSPAGRGLAAFAVGACIAGAYWFTSSTGFANHAVTVARLFTDTFAGMAELGGALRRRAARGRRAGCAHCQGALSIHRADRGRGRRPKGGVRLNRRPSPPWQSRTSIRLVAVGATRLGR